MKEAPPRTWKHCLGEIGLMVRSILIDSGVIVKMTIVVRYGAYRRVDDDKIYYSDVGQEETIDSDIDECHVSKRRIEELQMRRREARKRHADVVNVH